MTTMTDSIRIDDCPILTFCGVSREEISEWVPGLRFEVFLDGKLWGMATPAYRTILCCYVMETLYQVDRCGRSFGEGICIYLGADAAHGLAVRLAHRSKPKKGEIAAIRETLKARLTAKLQTEHPYARVLFPRGKRPASFEEAVDREARARSTA